MSSHVTIIMACEASVRRVILLIISGYLVQCTCTLYMQCTLEVHMHVHVVVTDCVYTLDGEINNSYYDMQ